ncbi:MAG: 16S rRNA (guanine(527)-N(7))-methyltransferase RsmG [Thermodesulfobacteriota bacterium]
MKDDGEIAVSHFLDSLSAAKFVRGAESLLDIGSGAGFPGIPLKIAMPELDVTLVESVHKKTTFMNEVIRELGLTGIRAVWGRAEDESNGVRRGAFPRVISRAVSGVKEVLALSEPYLSPAGSIILMRGRRGEGMEQAGEEVHARYRIAHKMRFTLPYGGQTRLYLSWSRDPGSHFLFPTTQSDSGKRALQRRKGRGSVSYRAGTGILARKPRRLWPRTRG